MAKYDAVIFDLDDTLLDTREYIRQPFNHTLAVHGKPPVTPEQMAQVAGLELADVFVKLGMTDEAASLSAEYRAFQKANPQFMKPFPGTYRVLEELQSRDIPVGIVTGRHRDSTNVVLEMQNLNAFVKAVVCNGDGYAPKPSAEPFLACAKTLAVPPKRVLSVGDGAIDVQGSKAAGMTAVRAMYGYGALISAHADYEIHSLEQVLDLL